MASFPHSAQAQFFSFISNVFAGDKLTDYNQELLFSAEENSQNIDLLKAPVNPGNFSGAFGGGDILIVDNETIESFGRSGSVDQNDVSDKSGRIRVYVVREGDSISQIAQMFGVSVNTVRWSNDIGPDESISPDQKLIILPITGVQYVVEEGDTVSSIAEKYGGDEEEIRNFNNLSKEGHLAVGDEIVIPNGEMGHTHEHHHDDSEGDSYVNHPAPSLNSPSLNANGYYAHPAPGGVVTQHLHGYNGIDFGSAYGTPIVASAPGTVIISRSGGWNGGYGSYIVIDHPNGTQTLYAHNSQNNVSVGQYVKRGEMIGRMGSTGRSTGNHVHFEVRGASNPFTGCALRTECR